jgi:hypothetical protein
MSEQRQTIVEVPPPANAPFGARNEQNLQSSYPHSPIHNGDLTDAAIVANYQELALDGVVNNGHGLNSFDRDFKGTTQIPVPDLSDVETGGGGLPASPYIPNLTSPGPGSLNAADQPEFNGTLPDPETNIEFGSGLGGLISPSETSERIAEQSLGNYISGKSYLGSDGAS